MILDVMCPSCGVVPVEPDRFDEAGEPVGALCPDCGGRLHFGAQNVGDEQEGE